MSGNCANGNSDSMTENSISSLGDLNPPEDQRVLNPALLSDHLSDGYSRSCSTEDSNFYLESNNKRESHALEPDLQCYEQIPELIGDFAPDIEYLEQANRKKDDSNTTRLTAQQRKHLEVLQALTDPENRKRANEGLVAAVCNDINRRFFMHEEKLRQFRRILSQPQKSKHEIIRELNEALGEQDKELVFIVACLMNDEEIVQILSDDPQFRVIRKALNMVMDVQAYVYGTRGLKTLKRIAANFRNEKLTDGEELKCILKNLFRRDDKLYKLFIPDDIQSINHERFEVINLSNGGTTTTDSEKITFETVEIPFNRPKQGVSKSQPQLKHGNIVIETSSGDTYIDVRYDFNRSWSPEEDHELLETMRENDFDLQVAAENYCRSNPNTGVIVTEAYQRLLDLQSDKK